MSTTTSTDTTYESTPTSIDTYVDKTTFEEFQSGLQNKFEQFTEDQVQSQDDFLDEQKTLFRNQLKSMQDERRQLVAELNAIIRQSLTK